MSGCFRLTVGRVDDGHVTESIVPDEGEHLTTGWEPEVPATDTLVRRATLVHASWAGAVAEALGRPHGRTERWSGGFVGDRGALTNPVVVLRPLGDGEWSDVVREVERTIPPPAPYFLLSPFPTPDLAGDGLVKLGHPPLMCRFPGGDAPPLRDGVEVREVTDVAALHVAERVLVDGYPMPELEPLVPGELFGSPILDGPTRVWTAFVDGVPAAVAAAHVGEGAVLVEYVAALASARGRGAGAAATWAATLCRPELPAVLDRQR